MAQADYDKLKQNTSLSSNLTNHIAYRNFMLSLRSESTRKTYSFYLSKFLAYNPKYYKLSVDEILKVDHKEIEAIIIETIIRMKQEENLSSSSTRALVSSLIHFFSINDVVLNRKKISKFVGEQQNKFEFRSYTHKEIASLLSVLDERGKAAVLLMATSGMRVGGLADIRLKHIQRLNIDDHNSNFVYKILVYGNSSKYKYITFCSPEAAKAIEEYLHMRKRCGENLHQDPETGNWTPGNTPLIIRAFDKAALNHSAIPVKPMTITKIIISSKLCQLGIRINHTLSKSTTIKRPPALYKYELHPCHSLRIFAITQMQRARLDKTIREMLVGHKTGLDSVYFKPQEEELLEEYLKAVDLLTINNENRLQKEVEHYKRKSEEIQEIREQLDKNYEAKIEVLKMDMEKKFKQLVDKVNLERIH